MQITLSIAVGWKESGADRRAIDPVSVHCLIRMHSTSLGVAISHYQSRLVSFFAFGTVRFFILSTMQVTYSKQVNFFRKL